MQSPSVTLLLNEDVAEAPKTIPEEDSSDSVTVGPVAKLYYSERIQSKISTGEG